MASNVQFQSSSPATPSSATLVQTVQQGDGSQRQVISVGDWFGSSTGAVSVTLSSNPTVIPSSNINVAITGVPTVTPSSNVTVALSTGVTNTVAVSSGTVTLSSAPSFAISSAISVSSGTVTLSSNPTVILSSNPTVIPSSNFTVALSTGVTNTVAVSSGVISATISSGTVTLSSNPTVILSSNPTVIPSSVFTVTPSSGLTVTSVSSGLTAISNGNNTAAVVAGSSTVTSTMPALVVALSTLGPFTVTTSTVVTLSSNPTVILSSNPTVILSSNPTVIPSSAFSVTLSSAVQVSSGTFTLSSNPTVIPSSIVSVMGDVANGSADSGNPVKIGGIYNSTNPTAVTSGQRVQAWFDKSGKQVVVGALRSLMGVTLTSVSSTTTETNITPASSAGLFLDLYGLVLSNLSTNNAQQVTIKDSSGGTSRLVFEVPSLDTRGFMVPVHSAIPQAASSQAWTATLSNSSGGFQVTALWVINP